MSRRLKIMGERTAHSSLPTSTQPCSLGANVHRYGLLCRQIASDIGDTLANTLLTEPSRPSFALLDDYVSISLKHFNRVQNAAEEEDPSVSTLTSTWFQGILNLKTNVFITVGSVETFLAGSKRLGGSSGGGKSSLSNARMLRSLDATQFFGFLCMSVIEFNFAIIEEIGDRMDDAELSILEELPRMHIYAEGDLTMSVARDVHVLKRELFLIRRSFWPCREALSTMLSSPKDRLRQPKTQQYVKQAYDYSVNLIDNAETLRELGTNLVELYSAQLSLVCTLTFDVLCCADTNTLVGDGETDENSCYGGFRVSSIDLYDRSVRDEF